MALLTKEQILAMDDMTTKDVEVPKWGTVRISTMSGAARDRYESSCLGKNGTTNFDNIRARLVAACVVDEKGELMFTEKDIIALGKKSGEALGMLFHECEKLNAMTDEDIEELAKN